MVTTISSRSSSRVLETLEKSPTSKLYTTWAHILSDRNVFAPRGGGGTAGSNAPGLFLFFLGGKSTRNSMELTSLR